MQHEGVGVDADLLSYKRVFASLQRRFASDPTTIFLPPYRCELRAYDVPSCLGLHEGEGEEAYHSFVLQIVGCQVPIAECVSENLDFVAWVTTPSQHVRDHVGSDVALNPRAGDRLWPYPSIYTQCQCNWVDSKDRRQGFGSDDPSRGCISQDR
jgi:hypothetical protein